MPLDVPGRMLARLAGTCARAALPDTRQIVSRVRPCADRVKGNKKGMLERRLEMGLDGCTRWSRAGYRSAKRLMDGHGTKTGHNGLPQASL